MKQVLSNSNIVFVGCSIFLLNIMVMPVLASKNERNYIYNYVTPSEVKKKSRVIRAAPIGGPCAYAIGAYGGDSFLILNVNSSTDYITVESGVFTLAIPAKRPLPVQWHDGKYAYKYLGKELIAIGRKVVLANKVLGFGDDGSLNDSTEFWLHDQYGILAYRPMTNPGRFVLDTLPSESLLSCKGRTAQ